METITLFIKDVIAEGKNINWPSRKMAVYLTVAVLVVSILIAYYLGLLDYLFSLGLKYLISR